MPTFLFLKKSRVKRAVSVLCALALLLTLYGCASTPKKHETQLFAMNTVMFLTAYGGSAKDGLELAKSDIMRLSGLLDPELSGSEVYRANHSPDTTVQVSEDFRLLLDTARNVFDKSGGALNIAVYPIVKAWGMIGEDYRVPEPDELAALIDAMDFEGITANITNGSAYVSVPSGTEISFGALAKGYAAEHAVNLMREAGVESAIVSLGGNVHTLGLKPDGSKWTVDIRDPEDASKAVGSLTVGGETAVVTSGGYERYFELDGTRYHHIIDPATGCPATSGLTSVTVVCGDGTLADALSTALFVLGEDAAVSYYREYGGFEAVLVTDTGRVIITPGLAGDFTEKSENCEYEYLKYPASSKAWD